MSSDERLGQHVATIEAQGRAMHVHVLTRQKRICLYVEIPCPAPEPPRVRWIASFEPDQARSFAAALAAACRGADGSRPTAGDEELRARGQPPRSWAKEAAAGVAGSGAPTAPVGASRSRP